MATEIYQGPKPADNGQSMTSDGLLIETNVAISKI